MEKALAQQQAEEGEGAPVKADGEGGAGAVGAGAVGAGAVGAGAVGAAAAMADPVRRVAVSEQVAPVALPGISSADAVRMAQQRIEHHFNLKKEAHADYFAAAERLAGALQRAAAGGEVPEHEHQVTGCGSKLVPGAGTSGQGGGARAPPGGGGEWAKRQQYQVEAKAIATGLQVIEIAVKGTAQHHHEVMEAALGVLRQPPGSSSGVKESAAAVEAAAAVLEEAAAVRRAEALVRAEAFAVVQGLLQAFEGASSRIAALKEQVRRLAVCGWLAAAASSCMPPPPPLPPALQLAGWLLLVAGSRCRAVTPASSRRAVSGVWPGMLRARASRFFEPQPYSPQPAWH
jgi:hypothetical protein